MSQSVCGASLKSDARSAASSIDCDVLCECDCDIDDLACGVVPVSQCRRDVRDRRCSGIDDDRLIEFKRSGACLCWQSECGVLSDDIADRARVSRE